MQKTRAKSSAKPQEKEMKSEKSINKKTGKKVEKKEPPIVPKNADKNLAKSLLDQYDKDMDGEMKTDDLIELLTDAYKAANKKIKINKYDIQTLVKLMDKDEDGKVTLGDLEMVVGGVMAKKYREEKERQLLIAKRKEQSKLMISPLSKSNLPPPKLEPPKKIKGKSVAPAKSKQNIDNKPEIPSKSEIKEKSVKPDKKKK